MKILVVGGLVQSLVNFRGPFLRALVAAGHLVSACANGRDRVTEQALRAIGVRYYPIRLSRAGMNPARDLGTVLDLVRLMASLRPDIVLAYTIKPVIYGQIAARLIGIPATHSLITGLGYAFLEPSALRQRIASVVARTLYQVSLKKSQSVFFQNPDDLGWFLDRKLIQPEQAVLINGSGVDLAHFALSPLAEEPVFLMMGRLLADKGVREYAEAAAQVRRDFSRARFLLAGDLDPNPNSIRENELRAWNKADTIEFLGQLEDVRPALETCRVYVLPSYREGTPRTVLEAMATGRPVITCDTPGCRETVLLTDKGKEQQARGESVMEGENGFLIRPRDADAVAAAMLRFLDEPDLIARMGLRSRKIAEEKYDVRKVNAVMMQEMGL